MRAETEELNDSSRAIVSKKTVGLIHGRRKMPKIARSYTPLQI